MVDSRDSISLGSFFCSSGGELLHPGVAKVLTLAQCSCKLGVKLSEAIKLLNELNGTVPPFDADVGRFHDIANVQDPLQDFFSTYIGSYIYIISYFKNSEHRKLPLANTDNIIFANNFASIRFRPYTYTYRTGCHSIWPCKKYIRGDAH